MGRALGLGFSIMARKRVSESGNWRVGAAAKVLGTHICGRQRRKLDTRTVFYNRPAAASQVHCGMLALMHPNLSTGNDKHTSFHTCDMSCAIDGAADQQALRNALDCEVGKGQSTGR